jgi:hypothetical protein
MSADSKRTAWWEASGIPFREWMDKPIELAFEQYAEKTGTKYQMELPRLLRFP